MATAVAIQLERALDDKDVHKIKLALIEYADAIQQVRMQIMARELLAKLLNGDLDETLSVQLRRLVQNEFAVGGRQPQIDGRILTELERYYEEVKADPASVLSFVNAHVDRIRELL